MPPSDAAHFIAAQKDVLAAQEARILTTKNDVQILKRHWRRTLYLALIILLGLVALVAADFLSLPQKYPQVFCWYDSVSKDLSRADATNCVSQAESFRAPPNPYRMALALSYPAAASFLNFFTVMPYTDPLRSHFLLSIIARHADCLTPVMLSGSPSQLSGPGGETLTATWLPSAEIYENASDDCGDTIDTLDDCPEVKGVITKSWEESCATGNPFVNLFQGPIAEIPSVLEYVSACISAKGDSSGAYNTVLYRLYEGGLQAAADMIETNGEDMYRFLFCPKTYVPTPYIADCDAEAVSSGIQTGIGLAFPFAGLSMGLEGMPLVSLALLGAATVAGVGSGIAAAGAQKKSCDELVAEGTKQTDAPEKPARCCAANTCLLCAPSEQASPKAYAHMRDGTCLSSAARAARKDTPCRTCSSPTPSSSTTR